jgi:hypothetical protein
VNLSSKELAVNTLQLGVFLLLASFAANAQTITLTTAANDGRPVDTIVRQIETLSGIPINYEDLLYSNPADTMNIATSVAPASSPGVQLIVPRGGALSVPITVDPVTQKLLDSLATANALSSLLSLASNSPIVAGTFRIDSYSNVFFIEPTASRSANNQMSPITSILSTPVDLPGTQQTAFRALAAILAQVSQKSGVTVKIGTIPIKPFAVTETTLAASSQPANYALATLFSVVSTSGGAPPGFQGMSYHAFFDPVAKYYVLNIHIVQNPKAPPPVPPSPPTPGVGSRLGKPSIDDWK